MSKASERAAKMDAEHAANMNWLIPRLVRAFPEYDLFITKEPDEITMQDIVNGCGFEDGLFRYAVCEIDESTYGNYNDRGDFLWLAYSYVDQLVDDLLALRDCIDRLDPQAE